MRLSRIAAAGMVVFLSWSPGSVPAGIVEYGDEDLCNTGTYSSDPKAGATLQGLAPGVVTMSSTSFSHVFPFSPTGSDYPGTDRIYVGSNQTATHDGYASYSDRTAGPQVITLDYSSLISTGQVVDTLTLGIAADDFQNPVWGNPYTASINGSSDASLASTLNGLNQTGPRTQFFTIGIDPSILASNHILTLSIDQGGDGGDGWAIDFLTVGVTTRASAAPEPSTIASAALGLAAFAALRRARPRNRPGQ